MQQGSLGDRSRSADSGIADGCAAAAPDVGALFAHLPLPWQALDLDGGILAVNAAWLELSGRQREAVLGQRFTDFLAAAAAAAFSRELEALRGKARHRHVDFELPCRDGSIRRVEGELWREDGATAPVYCLLNDVTERRQLEDAQSFLLEVGYPEAGEDFFAALARYLGTSLGMFYVCIDRLCGDGLSAETVAIWCDGHFEDNVSYALRDTPCGEVVGQTICCFPRDVSALFPRDSVLQELGADSYIGVTLWGSQGTPIGLIAVIGRGPLPNPRLAETMLRLVSVRAAAELERRAVEQALRDSQAFSLAVFDSLSEHVAVLDADGTIIGVNASWRRFAEANGAPLLAAESVGRNYLEICGAGPTGGLDAAQAGAGIRAVLDGARERFDLQYACDSEWAERCFEMHVLPLAGARRGVVVTHEDISQRKRAEAELRIAATAFEAQEGMVVTRADGRILRINRAFAEITGYQPQEALGQKMSLLKSGRHGPGFYAAMWQAIRRHGSWQGEIWDRRRNGEVFPAWLTITTVRNAAGEVTHCVGTLADITQRKAGEAAIMQLAFYDPLTRLPNRRLLLDRMRQAIAASARSGRKGALLFIDLDNFKMLNDTRGHDSGDLLLQQVAQRLTTCVREGDTVARLGGDEFIVMLRRLSDQVAVAAAEAESVGRKILAALNVPYDLAGFRFDNTPSIGITLINGREHCADELLRRADSAMYRAKAAGRNALCFYSAEP